VREKRHVVLVALERLSLAQERRLVVEAFALLAAQVGGLHVVRERAHAMRIEREFARRSDAHCLALRLGTLGDRIEGADALDFVAEQFDAERHVLGRRPHVDDAAATARLTGRRHLRLDAIAAGVERLQKILHLRLFAA